MVVLGALASPRAAEVSIRLRAGQAGDLFSRRPTGALQKSRRPPSAPLPFGFGALPGVASPSAALLVVRSAAAPFSGRRPRRGLVVAAGRVDGDGARRTWTGREGSRGRRAH